MKVESKLTLIDQTKQAVFQKIDNFFNMIIQIAEQRKEKLKREYLVIEEKERRSFGDSFEKIKQDSGDLQQISQAFTYFYQTFGKLELLPRWSVFTLVFCRRRRRFQQEYGEYVFLPGQLLAAVEAD